MIVKGGVPIRRIPDTPSVSILAGQRVFHKRADGTYDPKTITLKAEVKNVINPSYRWGRMVNGAFQTLGVNLSAMTIQPSHAGVIAVQVRGDNIPTYVHDYTSVSTVDDGLSAVSYKIEVRQLDKTVTSIPCDHQGNPKIYYQAIASLYKTVGEETDLCSDYLCLVLWYKGNTQVRSLLSPNPTASCAIDVAFDFDNVQIFFTNGGTPCANITIPKQLDGEPGTSYEVQFTQNGLVVDSIACTSDNFPKISPDVRATLYKIEGGRKQECADYYPKYIVYSQNNEQMDIVTGDKQSSFVEIYAGYDDEMYFNVQFREKNGTVIAEKSITRVSDGNHGQQGPMGRPGCAIRRSEWKSGVTYRNDETLNAVTRYLDMAMVRSGNSIGWRGYKCLKTHVSTVSNKPGNTIYWEELPINTVGILASLIIARDAKLDFLSGNEIRILDANDRVTAGVSGSGSGETGIRFYAGSDDPQNAPFRVDENGKVIAKNGEFKGMIEASGISMSDCAKLASAIFKGDYMFSQQGKNSNGGNTSEYQKFGTSDFIPNLQINLNTGEIIGNKCNLRGSLLTEMKYVSGGNVTVGNKNSDYAYTGDTEVNLTIFLAPGGTYGTETNIYLFGNGKITMAYFLLGSYFLYNGKLYQKIELNSPGSFVSLKHVRISSSIPDSQEIGFAIMNPANIIPSSTSKDTLVFTWR